jgi:hypothetical protein
MRDGFFRIYMNNVSTAHKIYGAIAQGLFDKYPLNRVMVKAIGSEIVRLYYHKSFAERKICELTPEVLVSLSNMKNGPLEVKELKIWLDGLRKPMV